MATLVHITLVSSCLWRPVQLFWWGLLAPCDVDWKWRGHSWLLGNYNAAQISNHASVAADKISISPNINQSCLCHANMKITFARNQQWASSFLLKDGFLNQTSKQIGTFSCQRKLMMLFFFFISHSIFSAGWLRKTLQLLMAKQWLTAIWVKQQ